MVGLCPFHDDGKPSMYVSPAKQIFKCFACGTGGNAITFLMRREQMSFPEAVILLAERHGISLPEKEIQHEEGLADRNTLERVNRWAARFFRSRLEDEQAGASAREYISSRKISADSVRRFGLGLALTDWEVMVKAATDEGVDLNHLSQLGLVIKRDSGGFYDRFRDRLIFPVIDALGRIIAFGGRTLGDDPAKYLNSPESVLFDKSRSLYGLNFAKDAIVKTRTAVVVEGYTDTIMAHQYEVNNVVATLGTSLTSEHARVLSRYADRIILVFDSDDAGRKAADRAIEIFFEQQIEVKIATLPEGSDPGDFLPAYGREAFEEHLAGAVDALDYKWRNTLARLESADTINGRKQAVTEFLGTISAAFGRGTMDGIARGFLLNHVAQLISIPTDEVGRMVRGLDRRGGRPNAGKTQPVLRQGSGRILNGRSRAHREILEVLLNQPQFFPAVAEVMPDPTEEISEPVLLGAADIIWNFYRENPEGNLAQLLARCQSPEMAVVITDLAAAGEERENYINTLNGALENIKRLREENNRQAIKQMAVGEAQQFGPDAQAAMLRDYQSQFRPDPRRIGVR